MSTFYIKQGCTLQAIDGIIRDKNGPVNLSGSSVRFRMIPKGGGVPVVDSPASIVDGNNGSVLYQWLVGDTDMQGKFEGEFNVSFGGTSFAVPTSGYINIVISRKLP